MTVRRSDAIAAVLLVVLGEVEVHGTPVISALLACSYLGVACATRRPLTVLVVIAAVWWADALNGGVLIGGIAAVLALAWLGFVVGSRRTSWLSALVGGAATVVFASMADQAASPGSFAWANDAVFYSAILLLPLVAASLIAGRSAQIAQLRIRTEELDRLRNAAVRAARAAETQRVERAVDGALALRLRTIIDEISSAAQLATDEPEAVPAQLRRIEDTARAALAQLRDVLDVLRPGTSDVIAIPAAGAANGSPRPRRRTLDRVDAVLVLALVPLAIETSLGGHRGPVLLNLLAAAGQAVALVWARRRPRLGALTIFAVATAQTALLTPLPPTVSWLLPAVLITFLLGRQLPIRPALAGFAMAVAGMAMVILATPPAHRALAGVVPGAVIALAAFWAARTVRARESRVNQLAALADELVLRREQEVALATVEQRAEMARELHDLGAHVLTVVCLQCGAAQATWDRDRTAALGALAVLRDLSADALTHLRVSLTGLADTPDRAAGVAVNVASLDLLAGLGRVLGLDVRVTVHGAPRPLTGDVSRAAFRVVQESLTNAARHAAHAQVDIGLSYAADNLEVLINDSGPVSTTRTTAVAITGSGAGLRGMRERVEACRGELDSGPCEGGGFRVRALLPLAAGP